MPDGVAVGRRLGEHVGAQVVGSAPGRLSTITGWPIDTARLVADDAVAMVSIAPPGGAGTTILMARAG